MSWKRQYHHFAPLIFGFLPHISYSTIQCQFYHLYPSFTEPRELSPRASPHHAITDTDASALSAGAPPYSILTPPLRSSASILLRLECCRAAAAADCPLALRRRRRPRRRRRRIGLRSCPGTAPRTRAHGAQERTHTHACVPRMRSGRAARHRAYFNRRRQTILRTRAARLPLFAASTGWRPAATGGGRWQGDCVAGRAGAGRGAVDGGRWTVDGGQADRGH